MERCVTVKHGIAGQYVYRGVSNLVRFEDRSASINFLSTPCLYICVRMCIVYTYFQYGCSHFRATTCHDVTTDLLPQLYAAQLFHCHKAIAPDRMLVVDSAALRRRPAETMRLVHDHLGIADYDYPTILGGKTAEGTGGDPGDLGGIDGDDDGGGGNGGSAERSHDYDMPFAGDDAAARLKSAFDAFYPSFESRTGWRMDGDYERIPKDIEAALRRFYAPFNGMLFGMLGRRFDWD